MEENKNIILAAGGTGGHFFPALALANYLRKSDYDVILITDDRCQKYVNEDCKDFTIVTKAARLRKKYLLPLFMLQTFCAVVKNIKIIRSNKANLVIGFGGYPTLAIMIAAILMRRKIILHEQNAIAGRVNCFFARFADFVAVNYEETRGFKGSDPVQAVGIPIRDSFVKGVKSEEHQDFRILVTGGSQGAAIFDEVVIEACKYLDRELLTKLTIVQQVRNEDVVDELQEKYNKQGIRAIIQRFFTDMDRRIADSDLVVARAGASTMAEIIHSHKIAIFVPYPHAKDDHQYFNAKSFADKEAAILIRQEQLDAKKLASEINNLWKNAEDREKLLKNIKQISANDARKNIKNLIEKLI